MKNIIATIAICLTATGCASVVSGPTKSIQISSAQESKISIANRRGQSIATGISPMTVNLDRGASYFQAQGYQVKISSPGFHTKNVDILPSFNPWYIANLFTPWWFGLPGMLIVDPITGAFYDLNPAEIKVDLIPTGEDIDMIKRQAAAIKRAQNFKVSKNDYTARQIALDKKCDQLATPEVTTENYIETLRFECKDGRSIEVTCKSEHCQ